MKYLMEKCFTAKASKEGLSVRKDNVSMKSSPLTIDTKPKITLSPAKKPKTKRNSHLF